MTDLTARNPWPRRDGVSGVFSILIASKRFEVRKATVRPVTLSAGR